MAKIKSSRSTDDVVEEHFSWAGYTARILPDADEAPDPMELDGYDCVKDRVVAEPDEDPEVEIRDPDDEEETEH
ncbi:MAG: hypothetical protein Q7R59_01240 [bacterium]|nr:hypothetical protein [bacterium]